MNRTASALLATSIALAAGVSVLRWGAARSAPFEGSGQSGATLSAQDVLAVVQDAGTLARATDDLYVRSIVTSGFDGDGGSGMFALLCNGNDCRYKLAEGSQMEMRASANDVSFVTSSVTLPTTFSAAYACKSNQNCYAYADNGYWFYFAPGSDVTGCAAGTAGGVKFRSTDSRLVNCDGTTVQRVAYSLSASASVDFASMADGAGDTKTVTVTGATTSDVVHCSPTNGAPEDGLVIRWARVSAADTVVLAALNHSGGVLDPASLTYTCVVTR